MYKSDIYIYIYIIVKVFTISFLFSNIILSVYVNNIPLKYVIFIDKPKLTKLSTSNFNKLYEDI